MVVEDKNIMPELSAEAGRSRDVTDFVIIR